MPWIPGKPRILRVRFHRYRCQKCGHTFNENITFKYPGTRVTSRAALWIKILLMHQMTIKAVSDLTGIHWGTVSKIHKEIMDEASKREARNFAKVATVLSILPLMSLQCTKAILTQPVLWTLIWETSSGLVRDAL